MASHPMEPDSSAVTRVTPAVRLFSIESERERPEDRLSQAISAAVKSHDENENLASRRFQEWGRWLRDGALDGHGFSNLTVTSPEHS